MEAEQVKASYEHVQTSHQLKHEDETPFTMEKSRELVSSPSNPTINLKEKTPLTIEKTRELVSPPSDPLLELKDETPFAMENFRELVSSPSNPPLEETPLTIEKLQELVSSPSNPPLELTYEMPFVNEKTRESSYPSNPPLELRDETLFIVDKTIETSSSSPPLDLKDEPLLTTERTLEASAPSNPPFELKHEDETPEKSPPNLLLEPPDNTSAKPNKSDTTTSEPIEMKSPPIQTMGQTPGYDPNRIPASIFSSKTGPGDWSATSNESLFSIHMGNNSFSRDYAILFGKSGELPKLDDWNGPQSNPFLGPGELPRLEEWNKTNYEQGKPSEFGSLPPVLEVPSQEESNASSGEFYKKQEDASPKFVSGQNIANHGNKHDVPDARRPPLPENNHSSSSYPASFPSPSRLSDASAHSGSSFAFPVLAGNDSGKNDSLKVVPEKLAKPVKAEQPMAQNQSHFYSETPTNITSTRWFSCFSRWPRFC